MDKKNKQTWKWFFPAIATMAVFLIILEWVHPYYFTCDDNLDSYIAVYDHTVRSFLHGEFATYNFHQFMGIPFLSHGQTGSFNLFTYIAYGLSYLFLGHKFGVIEIVSILHLTMGAAGMFFLLRKLDCSGFASYIGSVAWGLNSFNVYLGRAWLVVIIAAGFLPFLLLFSLNFIETPSFKTFLVTSGWKALFFYCVGQPQFFTYAIVVDVFFVFSYAMIVSGKKFKEIFALYFLSGIAVLFLCLPLLVPMYKEIASSINRSSGFTYEEILDGKEYFISFIIAVLFPFMPEGGATHSFTVFEFHAGHFGYVLAAALFVGGLYLAHYSKEKENTKTKKILLALTPPILISLLYGCSRLFLRLVSFIPVINQFRWPMKIIEFSLVFIIIFASVLLDIAMKYMFSGKKKEKAKKAAISAIAVINILNFAGLYYLFTPQLRGLNNSAAIPFEEDGADVIKGERYVSVFPTLGDSTPFDHNSSMAYNLATIYDMDSYLGYDSLVPAGVFERDQTLAFTYGGIIYRLTETSIQAFRSCGVRWYVVYHGEDRYLDEWEKENIPQARKLLEENGCVIRYSSKDRDFYYDNAAPAVISGTDREFPYTIYGNYIQFSTDENWTGGDIDIRFNYSDKLKATIDGESAELRIAADNTGMTLTVPQGEHKVQVRYHDAFLMNFAIDIVAFAAVCAVVVLLLRKKKGLTN